MSGYFSTRSFNLEFENKLLLHKERILFLKRPVIFLNEFLHTEPKRVEPVGLIISNQYVEDIFSF